jgi:hypothetical protein
VHLETKGESRLPQPWVFGCWTYILVLRLRAYFAWNDRRRVAVLAYTAVTCHCERPCVPQPSRAHILNAHTARGARRWHHYRSRARLRRNSRTTRDQQRQRTGLRSRKNREVCSGMRSHRSRGWGWRESDP